MEHNLKSFHSAATTSISSLTGGQHQQRGTCTLFQKRKNKYDSLSNRCKEIFEKEKTFHDGSELVIVQKNTLKIIKI